MKATMDARGMLVITPETGLEAFALSHWARANIKGSIGLIIDASSFAQAAGLHASDCAIYNEPAYPAGKCDCGATP